MKGGRGVAQRVTVGGAGEARGVAEVEPDEYVNGEGGEEAAAVVATSLDRQVVKVGYGSVQSSFRTSDR